MAKSGKIRRSPFSRKKNTQSHPFLAILAILFIGFLAAQIYQRKLAPDKQVRRLPTKVRVQVSPREPGVVEPSTTFPVSKPTIPESKPLLQPVIPTEALPPLVSSPILPQQGPWMPTKATPDARFRTKVWTKKPKIVFVIDDIGYHKRNLALFQTLGHRVTCAILPQLTYSEFYSRLSRETGAEVILHQPLESTLSEKRPGAGLITTSMKSWEMLEMLEKNLATVPDHVGVNNHMGSLGSADYRVMSVLLRSLRDRGVFFMDSHTTAGVVSPRLARELSYPTLERDVFLDNMDEKNYIHGQVNEVRAFARRKGYTIAIGHDRANTLSTLIEEIPRLESEGFQVVSLTDLVEHRVGTQG